MSKVNCNGSSKEEVIRNFQSNFDAIFGDLKPSKRPEGDFYRSGCKSVTQERTGTVIKSANGR